MTWHLFVLFIDKGSRSIVFHFEVSGARDAEAGADVLFDIESTLRDIILGSKYMPIYTRVSWDWLVSPSPKNQRCHFCSPLTSRQHRLCGGFDVIQKHGSFVI